MKGKALRALVALAVSLQAFAAQATCQERGAEKVEVGVQFSSLSVRSPDFFRTDNRPGLGARLGYDLTDHFAVEGELNYFPTAGTQIFATGGRALQSQFGVKVGRRFQKFGVFGKARPGFVSFSDALVLKGTQTVTMTTADGQTQQFTAGVFDTSRRTYFSTDLGGVLELYPSRRLVTRFDFGDTIIRYGTRHLPVFGVEPGFFELAPQTRHSFQFSAGFALRF